MKPKSIRRKKCPTRFNNYWDMEIPTEFYDEEFIEFESYLESTRQIQESSSENPHSQSEFSLREYEKLRKYVKQENKKLFRRIKRNKGKPDGNSRKVREFL